jgi:hypothetical protein
MEIGDRVKIISSDQGSVNEVGDKGIITEIDTDGTFRVLVEGRENWGNWHDDKEVMLIENEKEVMLIENED